MAKVPFNANAVDPATAEKLGLELHAEIKKTTPDPAHIRQLVKDGADMELRNGQNNTVLLAAAMAGREEAAMLLVDLGAVPDAEGTGGATPLILAAFGGSSGWPKLVSKLLDNNVAPDKVSFNGKTALMWAAHRGFRGIASEIAMRGGDILLKSTGDIPMNAIEWAEDNNKKAMADDLRKIQKRKNEIAEEKARQEAARAAEAAERLQAQQLDDAIVKGVMQHKALVAPERATFKKKSKDHQPP